MKKKKIKNPLSRLLPREFIGDMGKNLGIFILMTSMIALISGFLVADNSMLKAYNEGFEKYSIEDGHFRTEKALNKSQLREVSGLGISIYPNYYAEESQENGSKLRIFRNRCEVNLICLMAGVFPEQAGEIAVDRMYAENNGFSIGDTITSIEGTVRTITGLVALPDYSCLFENNSDSMFDATLFGVAILADEDFSQITSGELFYNYAWCYNRAPVDEKEERDMADDLLKELNSTVTLKDYLPRYTNNAINFTGDDMGSDKGMMIVLLYMLILILAFVFAITTSNTITKEAAVIGTLRASGYSKWELIRHYMALPVIITLVSALFGNVLGYTIMKDVCAGMYYGSYSLPTYVTVWNGEAFLETTVGPLLLVLLITFVILYRKLCLSPRQFLSRDLSRRKNRRMLPLPAQLPFLSRFRMRVFFQNIPNYLVLALGILLANLLLLFGLGLPAVLDIFEETVENSMIATYQYMLELPASMQSGDSKLDELLSTMTFLMRVETENPDAEKFMAGSFRTMENEEYRIDEIVTYGIEENSRYVELDVNGGKTYISSAIADKYGKAAGDTMTLREEFGDKTYTFCIDGIYEYEASLCIFTSRENLNAMLDYDDEMFAGYFSDTAITDIDKEYIGTVIDQDAMTKVSRQLKVSMGSMMSFVVGIAIIIFMVLIYILSKIIIEKNAQSISMAKILGYTNPEILRIYVLPTTLVVLVFLLLSLPIELYLLKEIFHWMMLYEMNGWIPLTITNNLLVQVFLIGAVAYLVIAVFEYVRIYRVPKDMALKNVE